MSVRKSVKKKLANWSYEKIMLLIETLESLPVLWNVSLKEYRDRNKKTEAITQLAHIVEMDEAEVSRKLHNLRCQVNSELRKIKRKKSGQGAAEIYESKWEFFEPLRFLIGASECSETISSAGIESEVEDSTRPCETPTQNDTILEIDKTTPSKSLAASPKTLVQKRKKENLSEDAALNRAYAVLEKPPDDHQVFGDFVATELRQMRSEENRKKLKRMIQRGILFMTELDDSRNSTSTDAYSAASQLEHSSEAVCTTCNQSSAATTSCTSDQEDDNSIPLQNFINMIK